MRARDVIELSDNESEFSGSIALFKIRDDQSGMMFNFKDKV